MFRSSVNKVNGIIVLCQEPKDISAPKVTTIFEVAQNVSQNVLPNIAVNLLREPDFTAQNVLIYVLPNIVVKLSRSKDSSVKNVALHVMVQPMGIYHHVEPLLGMKAFFVATVVLYAFIVVTDL